MRSLSGEPGDDHGPKGFGMRSNGKTERLALGLI